MVSTWPNIRRHSLPNLVLTLQCDRHCSYCFAAAPENYDDYTLASLTSLQGFIASFNRRRITLLGGEPSRCADFIAIIRVLQEQGLGVQVFSNGHLSPALISSLQGTINEDFRLCINRSDSPLSQDQKNLYAALGFAIQLAVTVYHPGQSLSHIFSEIDRYKLQATYRLGIALPVWRGEENHCLEPASYRQTADSLYAQIMAGLRLGFCPSFDCGFPLCFFTGQQREELLRHGVMTTSCCGIVPDILSGPAAIPCFALQKLGFPIAVNERWPQVEQRMTAELERLPRTWLYPECAECRHRESGACSGGCLAWRLPEAL